MKRRYFAGAAATVTCLSSFILTGCSNLNSKLLSWGQGKSSSSSPTVQLGKIQSDSLGRPTPGSKIPVQPTLEEAKPEISDQTRSHVALAMGEMMENSGSLEVAQEHYELALKHDPKSLPAALALARVYSRLGRPDAALKVYHNAERYHRRSAALFNDKGLLLAEQKDLAGAIAALRTSTKLEPSQDKYHNNLGMVLALSGNYEEAWKEFRDAVGPAAAHYNVALIMFQNNQRVEARNHLERALVAMPNFQKAQELLVEMDGRDSRLTSMPSPNSDIVVNLEEAQGTLVAPAGLPAADSQDPTAETAFHSVPFDSPTKSDSQKEDKNPWAGRWVPPKWLR